MNRLGSDGCRSYWKGEVVFIYIDGVLFYVFIFLICRLLSNSHQFSLVFLT